MPSSRTSHRLQFAAAILGTVGAIYGISRLVKSATPPPPAPLVVQPAAPPIVPRVDPPLKHEPIKPSVSQAFLDAVREGDLAKMEKAYEKDMRLDGTLGTGAATGNTKVVEWLLAHGVDVHEAEADLEAPILAADAYPEMVKLLIGKGAKEPTLALAVTSGSVNAVTRLLAAGVSPKATENGGPGTLLIDAIDSATSSDKRQQILDKLLAAGADANARDGGRAPLSAAVSRCEGEEGQVANCKKMIAALVAKGARVDADVLQAAIDIGEDASRMAAIDAILPAKFEVNAVSHACASLAGERDVPVLKKLAPKGISWAFVDGEAEVTTPFLDAVDRMDLPIAKAMLDLGAPGGQRPKDGRSALGIAIEHAGSDDTAGKMVELLLAHGASATKRLADGRTPLFAAAEAGDVRIVNALLAHGARVNEQVLDETALDAAERSGHVPIARVLHAHGGRRAPKQD